MSCRSKTLFLISYDNGQQYEDHWRSPELIVASKSEAERIVAKVMKWVERKKVGLPPRPHDVTTERENDGLPPLTDEEYLALNDARNTYLNALKPPCGMEHDHIREMVEGGHGSLQISEIPFIAK